MVTNTTQAPPNDVLIVGSFSDDIAFGAHTLHSNAASDGFVVRMTSAGSPSWATSVGGARLDDVKAVSMLGDRVIISGTIDGDAMIGALPVSAVMGNQSDVYVAGLRYAAGTSVTATVFGGAGADGLVADACVAQGTVILTGGFLSRRLDFGAGVLANSSTGTDAYLARVLPP